MNANESSQRGKKGIFNFSPQVTLRGANRTPCGTFKTDQEDPRIKESAY